MQYLILETGWCILTLSLQYEWVESRQSDLELCFGFVGIVILSAIHVLNSSYNIAFRVEARLLLSLTKVAPSSALSLPVSQRGFLFLGFYFFPGGASVTCYLMFDGVVWLGQQLCFLLFWGSLRCRQVLYSCVLGLGPSHSSCPHPQIENLEGSDTQDFFLPLHQQKFSCVLLSHLNESLLVI